MEVRYCSDPTGHAPADCPDYEPVPGEAFAAVEDLGPMRFESAGIITPRTVDLTPSPDAYRAMLRVIALDSTVQADREWALSELTRVGSVTEWGQQ